MRDPLAPLPSPAQDPSYWECTVAPRTTLAEYPADPNGDLRVIDEVPAFEPMRLLGRNLGDVHGIDRRSRRRHGLAKDAPDEHGGRRLISAGQRSLRLVLGLSSAHGWSLVHTITLSSTGVLLHLLDLMRPDLDAEIKALGRAALRQLAPILEAPLRNRAVHGPGSPLATISGCLLAPRVIADLSAWASSPSGRRGSSSGPSSAHAITLLMPSPEGPARIEGELVPMNDPRPEVLAISLSERGVAALRTMMAAPPAHRCSSAYHLDRAAQRGFGSAFSRAPAPAPLTPSRLVSILPLLSFCSLSRYTPSGTGLDSTEETN